MDIESGIKTIERLIPFLANYENWVKWFISIWVLLTAVILVSLLFPKKTSSKETTTFSDTANKELVIDNTKKWIMTGDVVIDQVLKNLNELEKKGKDNISEIELVSALRPLITRPAFYGIREENWSYFLYPLCKTRTLLEFYTPYFKSAKIRTNLSSAIQSMVTLQNDVAKIYGIAFSVTEHIHKYIDNSKEFIKNLPSRQFEPDYNFFNERDKTIRKIRATLYEVGLSEK